MFPFYESPEQKDNRVMLPCCPQISSQEVCIHSQMATYVIVKNASGTNATQKSPCQLLVVVFKKCLFLFECNSTLIKIPFLQAFCGPSFYIVNNLLWCFFPP